MNLKFLKSINKLTIIFLVILSLTPLLWFYQKGNMVIDGVDTNFPLDPIVWFLRRFYVWNSIANAGSDFSSSTAGLFFHLIQVIPYQLGASLTLTQIISLVFWFGAIVFASYLFARQILPGKPLPQFVFVVFYAFNIYLFNTWENVKVSNLSLMVSFPLLLTILTSFIRGQIALINLIFYSMVTAIIASGSGINPAYFLVLLGGTSLYILIYSLVEKDKKLRMQTLKGLLVSILILFLVNSFWIFSTFDSLFLQNNSIRNLSDIGYTDWLDSLSENTSLINVMRGQGAWDWYAFDQTSGLPLYISYAVTYMHKLPFVLFSFFLPALLLISLLFRVEGKKSLYAGLGVLLALGIFLGTGSHEPTGSLYKQLVRHIPFFSFFRSPWYIFTPFVILASAGLISLLIYSLDNIFITKKTGNKYIFPVIVLILIIGNMIYSYPLVGGKIFRTGQPDSFFVHFPGYILQSRTWLNQQKFGRIIGYPDDEIEQFKWGYRGIESILGLMTSQEVLFPPLNSPNAMITSLIREFYNNLKKDQLESAKSLAAKLNISVVLEKKDQPSLAPGLSSGITSLPVTNFGLWNFYNLPQQTFLSKIYSTSSLLYGYPYEQGYEILPSLDAGSALINPDDSIVSLIPGVVGSAGQISLATNSQTKDFSRFENDYSKLSNRLLHRDMSKVNFQVDLSRNGSYQPILERYRLANFGIDLSHGLPITLDGKETIWEIEHTSDSYVYFKPIQLVKGQHNVVLDLKGKNVVLRDDFSKNNFEQEGGGEFRLMDDSGNSVLNMFNRSEKSIFANFYLPDFNPLSIYLIQLRYKQIYGNNAAILVGQMTNTTPVKVVVERMPNYPEWNSFSFYYHPVVTSSKIKIAPEAPFTKDPLGTKILYDDLEVVEVFTNRLLFAQNSANVLGTPVINFDKKSPVLYEGSVSKANKPHVIIFSENYSPAWDLTLYDINGTKLSIKPQHFSVNLYANAWYIEGTPENYKIKIYYQPQTIYVIGLAISFGTILAVLIITIWSKIKLIKS